MSRKISASAAIAVPPATGRTSIVAFNVGPGGELLFVSALHELDYQFAQGIGIFAKVVPGAPQDYCVHVVRQDVDVRSVQVLGLAMNIHHVELLGDQLLLVSARSHRKGPDQFDRNGRLYSLDGSPQGEIFLGDGIESLQATHSGEIWVAYFDEGIFGNYGWREPGGRSGLVAWNRAGTQLFEFEPPSGFDVMADCYAMNVAQDGEVWCCYYTEFPLVRIRNRRVESAWRQPIHGAKAFAVAGEYVLMTGGYDGHDKIHRLHLEANEEVSLAGEFEVIDRRGNPVSLERVVGRGSKLYALAGEWIYIIDVNDVMSQHPRDSTRRTQQGSDV